MKIFNSLILFSLLSSNAFGKITTQAELDEFTQKTTLWFSATDNLLATPATFNGQIELINNSTLPLPQGQSDWAIYFHLIRKIEDSLSQGVKIEHVQGDLHRLVPTTEFAGLASGASLSIAFSSAP